MILVLQSLFSSSQLNYTSVIPLSERVERGEMLALFTLSFASNASGTYQAFPQVWAQPWCRNNCTQITTQAGTSITAVRALFNK